MTGAALVLLWWIMATPAHAAEVLHSLQYSGKPDLTAIYGWENLTAINDLGVISNGALIAVAGRGNTSLAPPSAWCQGVVATLRGLSPKPRRVFIDWETIAVFDTAGVQAFVPEATSYLACLRAHHRQTGEFLYGWFSYLPLGARFDAMEQGPSGANWGTLQSDQGLLHPLAAQTDFFTLAFYYPQHANTPEQHRRFMVNLARQARLMARQIGQPAKPVYCWTYQRSAVEDTAIAPERYEQMLRLAHALCDGVILWDWNIRSWATETSAAWWPRVQGLAGSGRSYRSGER